MNPLVTSLQIPTSRLVIKLHIMQENTPLSNITIDDIQDLGKALLVTIRESKTKIQRVFSIIDNENKSSNFLENYRKYASLHPQGTDHRRFFVYYKNNKCSRQVVGKNMFGQIPFKIATYLKLPNAREYTGHCFRRSSATLLADAGENITNIKRHAGWKSTAVAESYIEGSVANKLKIGLYSFNRPQATQTWFSKSASSIKKVLVFVQENYSSIRATSKLSTPSR
ncbi:hypothetical protein NQ317_000107 [Molorchus minor]|uniref:Tyr recombinase domain-containing protein n=1 Tax=Molorchus minor TaxID=1323400 RepID=A0ABQ9JKZ9_9CUCU|nr:hypothetical protein NQ317_000107 [Molorchus minor]